MVPTLDEDRRRALLVVAGLDFDRDAMRRQREAIILLPRSVRRARFRALGAAYRRFLAREAYRPRKKVEAIVGRAIVEDLLAADLAVEWAHGDGPQLAPTPIAVALLGIAQAVRVEAQRVPHPVEPHRSIFVLVEVDYWDWPYEAKGARVVIPKVRGVFEVEALSVEAAESIPDHRPGPVEEFLRDEEGAEVLLFGAKVRRDRRIRAKGQKAG